MPLSYGMRGEAMMMHKTHKEHTPVLLAEVLQYLNTSHGGDYLDCTFGRGGYTRGILEANGDTHVFAVDRDPFARGAAADVLKNYPGRFQFDEACFDQIGTLYQNQQKFNGIVWDLGVSSPQIDDPTRGFSFREDGPLDMRMSCSGVSAQEIVNSFPEEDLANLIYQLGEERRSRAVARIICKARQDQKITTTRALADLVRKVVPKSKDGIDPATRTFQALRLAVNDELGQIRRSLEQALTLLHIGGRLVVVSFHSLEDRIVKHFISNHVSKRAVNKYRLQKQGDEGEVENRGEQQESLFEVLTKKPLEASSGEARENPRARSAKLRAVELVRLP